MDNFKIIKYPEFLESAKACRTSSITFRPDKGEKAITFECTVKDFIEHDTYPACYVNSSGSSLVGWNDTDANPIRFSDFVTRKELVDYFLKGWYKEEKGPIIEASVISICCVECERRVVIDGNHSLAWLGVNSYNGAKVYVVELSGSNWPKDTPDLNIVCECKAPMKMKA